jgi:hypothetical protein
MGDSKVYFIIGAFAFITFVTQIGALMGSSIISDAPPSPTIPDNPELLDYVFWPIDNMAYFLLLATLSSGYAFVSIILGIFSLGIVWAVIELVRGV